MSNDPIIVVALENENISPEEYQLLEEMHKSSDESLTFMVNTGSQLGVSDDGSIIVYAGEDNTPSGKELEAVHAYLKQKADDLETSIVTLNNGVAQEYALSKEEGDLLLSTMPNTVEVQTPSFNDNANSMKSDLQQAYQKLEAAMGKHINLNPVPIGNESSDAHPWITKNCLSITNYSDQDESPFLLNVEGVAHYHADDDGAFLISYDNNLSQDQLAEHLTKLADDWQLAKDTNNNLGISHEDQLKKGCYYIVDEAFMDRGFEKVMECQNNSREYKLEVPQH